MKTAIPLVLALALPLTALANDASGLSIVPYVGFSALGDQTARSVGLSTADGEVDVSVDAGFTAGLSLRYDYVDSPWSSEFGWEYRANDADITDAAGVPLPSGNYASNIFYLNGRYALAMSLGKIKPYIGAGLTVIQEVDLDSEGADGELSFSDGGSVGLQIMTGLNMDLTDKLYMTAELRYSDQRSLTLRQEEGGSGEVRDIDYQPVTALLGVGYRF